MRIYISGKISGLDEATVTANFERGGRMAGIHFAQYCATNTKIEIINPFEYVAQQGTYNDMMRQDIIWLMRCSGIWMLKDWKESKGAQFEHYIADWLKFAIGYEND